MSAKKETIKSETTSIIDFAELTTYRAGHGLEALARKFGERKGFKPQWSGVGPDKGKDLIFTDIEQGSLGDRKVRYLVQCKDKNQSGKPVYENELGSLRDKIGEHDCKGYLLITTTIPAANTKSAIDALNNSELHGLVWDRSELESQLLCADNEDLFKQFFPNSYQHHKQLEMRNTLHPIARELCPDDEISQKIIDLAMYFVESDVDRSARAIGLISDPKLIVAWLEEVACKLQHHATDAAVELVKSRISEDMKVAIADFVVQEELEPEQLFEISWELREITDGLVRKFIDEVEAELNINSDEYNFYSDLNSLAPRTYLGNISVDEFEISRTTNKHGAYGMRAFEITGTFGIEIELEFGGKNGDSGAVSRQFDGSFRGNYVIDGLSIKEAIVNTDEFREMLRS